MREVKIESVFRVYENESELTPADKQLVIEAIEATHQAYAPYSDFLVGAVLAFEDGTKLSGSNQENAAYPSGLCAERTALFAAGHQFPGKRIHTIAVAARSESHHHDGPVAPCGACLQVLSESERRQKMPIRILLYGNNGEIMECASVKTLMPLQFELD